MLTVILFMALLSAGLIFSRILLRREIQSLNRQLQEADGGAEKPVEIVFVDRYLTDLAVQINKNQALQKEKQLSLLRKERRLKEAISNLSHDLRTPLTSMTGYLQMLQKTDLTKEQGEYVETALSRGRYLQNLISDFYELSLLDGSSDSPVLVKINLDKILSETILSFTEQLKEREITPSVAFLGAPAYVMADEIMLRRTVTNLVSNALRYGKGELRVQIVEREYVEVLFQNKVEQGGEPDVERLFDQFYTADQSRSRSGSGLGLYIVKVLAQKMNGRVSAVLKDGTLTIALCLIKA